MKLFPHLARLLVLIGALLAITAQPALAARDQLNLGSTANDGTGTTLRAGGTIINKYIPNATTSDPTTSEKASSGYYNGALWVNTTTGNVFVLNDDTNGIWAPLAPRQKPGYTTGYYYPLTFTDTATPVAGAAIVGTTSTGFQPVMFRANTSFTTIGLKVATAGTNLYWYLYPASGSIPAGAAPICSGIIDVTSTTGLRTATITACTPKEGVLYFAAFQSDNTALRAEVYSQTSVGFLNTLGTTDTADISSSPPTHPIQYELAGTTAGTPPDVSALTRSSYTTNIGNTRVPIVWFRP